MSIDYQPWELIAGNGCVPDLTTGVGWPEKPTGHATERDSTLVQICRRCYSITFT